MLKALLAVFRPLHTIARELTTIRELYELELSNRLVDPRHVERPLMRITEKPKKGDVEVTYQGDVTGPAWKQLDWDDGPEEELNDTKRA